MTLPAKPIVTIGYTGKRGGAGLATVDFAKIAAKCLPGSYSIFATNPPRRVICRVSWVLWWLLRVLEYWFIRVIFDDRIVKQSLNSFSEPRIKHLLCTNDRKIRFHLHWIANSTISLRYLNRLPAGTIITLHDEWLIAGSSHYAPASGVSIQQSGRSRFGRLAAWLDRRAYDIKKRALSNRNDLVVTVPSTWMKQRVVASGVFKKAKIAVIPNGIDTKKFFPADDRRSAVRRELGLTNQDFLVCFGADRSARNPLKGTDLFLNLLALMAREPERFARVTVMVFGGLKIDSPAAGSVRIINVGQIDGREALADLFRASDVILHLARLEAFGLVPCEAMSCGTPVICFDNSGAAELVIDSKTGYICKAFDIEAVAKAIITIASASSDEREKMGLRARQHMEDEYSVERLSERYCALLKGRVEGVEI